MNLYFKAEITDSVWAEPEYLPFTFAVIDGIFYIEEIDYLNTKYWKRLDIDTLGDRKFSSYFASIQYFFYRRLGDSSIPEEIWNWISQDRYVYMETEAIHDADFLSDVHDDYENFVKKAFSNIYYSIDAMKLLLKELEYRNKSEDFEENLNRNYLIKVIKERINNDLRTM